MKQDGYTAIEALVALAVIGMAIGGLATSMSVIGKGQANAQALLREAGQVRATHMALAKLVIPEAPFRSDDLADFVGDAEGFELRCGPRRCSASIKHGELRIVDASGAALTRKLPKAAELRFRYVGSVGDNASWPPEETAPPAPTWQPLRAIVVESDVGQAWRPLTVVQVWSQQRYDCEFDTVIQDCRKTLQ